MTMVNTTTLLFVGLMAEVETFMTSLLYLFTTEFFIMFVKLNLTRKRQYLFWLVGWV